LSSSLPSGPLTRGLESSTVSHAFGLVSPLLRRWWPAAAAVIGGSVVVDALGHVLHLPLTAAGIGAAGLLVVCSRRRVPGLSRSTGATDGAGWLQRLDRLLQQFDALEAEQAGQLAGHLPAGSAALARRSRLEQLKAQSRHEGLQLAVVGEVPAEGPWRSALAATLQGSASLTLHWSRPLPAATGAWHWPEPFAGSDLLLYCLKPPLMASDLRWLQALPAGQPLWILLQLSPGMDSLQAERELLAQVPAERSLQLISLPAGQPLEPVLQPLATLLARERAGLRRQCRERCLADQHRIWQAELETLRRARLGMLQQRTQWIVAAAVVAAPLPSLDLLVLAVANGLMVKEMARLWDSPWSAEQLQATVQELARACLALGVVEWTGQALAGVVKWHGATWLLGSTVQALSAAYLTRVIGRAMADTLARSVGVAEPDLERIRREAPLLVSQAAESERLDWSAFVQQGRRWLADQAAAGALNPAAISAATSAAASTPASTPAG
jgi:uncharacterized protein (DUF697 family)